MECDPPKDLTSRELWVSRPEYQEFARKTFRNHVAQQKRYFRQFPGWQKERNDRANEAYREAVADERRAQRHYRSREDLSSEEEG